MSAIVQDLVLLIVFAIVNYGLLVFPYKFMMKNFGSTGVLVYYGVFALVFGWALLFFDLGLIFVGTAGNERLA
jgi:hypothetical protein|tara:strand:- start:13825 stop:14043 length:219 start_codon:yes stop_codon:yes gene_type:complete